MKPSVQNAEIYVSHIGWFTHDLGDDVAKFLAEGWFETREQAFFWLYLRPGDLVIDGGAHAGLYTLLAARKGARVLAIEPHPVNREFLQANVAAHKCSGVTVIPKALDRSSGKGRLTLSRKGAAYASLAGSESGETIEVDTISMDELAVDSAALVKLDVEGAEPRVVEGAANLIACGRLVVWMIEFTRTNLERAGSAPEKLFNQLRDRGHKVCRFTDELELIPLSEPGPCDYENYFAVTDLAAASDRLRTASPVHQRIARDLVTRGKTAQVLAEARTELEKARIRLSDLDAAYAKLGEARWTIGDLRERLSQEKNFHDENGREIGTLRARIQELEPAELESKQLAAKVIELEKSSGSILSRLEEATASIADLNSRFHEVTRDRDVRVEEIRALRSESAALHTELQPIRDSQEERARTIFKLVAEVSPKSPSFPITVAICTHNPGRELLRWALSSIAVQTLKTDQFNAIIVDNDSDPPLRMDELGHTGAFELTLIREPRRGLIYARQAAIRSSDSPLVVFIDDDNFIYPDYLEQAIRIAAGDSSLGAFGGRAYPLIPALSEPWMLSMLPFLGTRDYGEEPIVSGRDEWGQWEPIGAGFVLRRAVGEKYLEFLEEDVRAGELGRRGRDLMSGEDSLLARCAYRVGLKCGYQPGLTLWHYMKPGRLTFRTISKTMYGHGRSHVRLERVLGKHVATPGLASVAIDLVQRWRYRAKETGWKAGTAHWFWDVGYFLEARSIPK